MVRQTQRPWVRQNPTSLSDPMSDRKKKFSPTLRNIYKKQHGARPCVEKMQLIFFVPPNEELEIAGSITQINSKYLETFLACPFLF